MTNPKKLNAQKKTKVQRKAKTYMEMAADFISKDTELQNRFNGLSETLQRIHNLTDTLSARDEEGRAVIMQAAQMEQLKQLYTEAQQNCSDVLELSVKKGCGTKTPFYQTVKKISGYVAKDIDLLRKMDPERGMSFPAFVEAAHTELINIDQIEPDHRHGAMSDRMAMNVVMEDNGNRVMKKGLFTAQSKVENPLMQAHDVLLKYRDAGLRDVVNLIAPVWQANSNGVLYYIANITMNRDNEGRVIFGYKNDALVPDQRVAVWVNRVAERYHDNPQKLERFAQMINELQTVEAVFATYKRSGIRFGRRLDQRNSAMSAVADLIGMPDIIAKSVPMSVKKDGNVVKGTFMSFADGQDVSMIGTDSVFGHLDYSRTVRNVDLLKSVSDLQVLDFICGNVDRHGANMFYKVEHGVVTGVQGIDNDLSFGALKADNVSGKKPFQHFTGLKNLSFVTEETAAKVRALTPETLKTVLSHYDLNNDEINSAVERLNMLKKSLDDRFVREDNPEVFTRYKDEERTQRTLDGKHVYILNHQQIRSLNGANDLVTRQADDFGELASMNHFTRVFGILQEARHRALSDDGKYIELRAEKDRAAARILEDAPVERAAAEFKPAEYAEKLAEKIEVLKQENKGAFVSSKEYDNLMNYAEVVRTKLAGMGTPTAAKRALAGTMMENLNFLATVYLDKKSAEKDHATNERSGRRMLAVKDLQDSVKNRLSKLDMNDRDCYCRLNSVQRADAFRNKTDRKTIADSIQRLQQAQRNNRTIADADLNLNGIFTAVTAREWQKTINEYRTEAQRYADSIKHVNGVPQALSDSADALVQNIAGLNAENFSMDQMQGLLNGFAEEAKNYLQQVKGRNGMTVHKPDGTTVKTVEIKDKEVKGLCGLQGMLRLAQKAGKGYVSVGNEFERLSERLQEISFRQTGNAETRMQLLDQKACVRQLREVLNSNVVDQMTANKGVEKIGEMSRESDAKLLERYRKAANVKVNDNPSVQKTEMQFIKA